MNVIDIEVEGGLRLGFMFLWGGCWIVWCYIYMGLVRCGLLLVGFV